MKIFLSKPIPAEGRIPTASECSQFRRQNVTPTRSGAWKVCWNSKKDGTDEPCISFFDKRSGSGCGYLFEAILPEPKPKKQAPLMDILCQPDRESTSPDTWLWER